MTIDDYFSALERGLRQNLRAGKIADEITCLVSDDYNGLLRCRVVFWDESFLDLYEVVSTELGYPVRVHYAYTYLRSGHGFFGTTTHRIIPKSSHIRITNIWAQMTGLCQPNNQR